MLLGLVTIEVVKNLESVISMDKFDSDRLRTIEIGNLAQFNHVLLFLI